MTNIGLNRHLRPPVFHQCYAIALPYKTTTTFDFARLEREVTGLDYQFNYANRLEVRDRTAPAYRLNLFFLYHLNTLVLRVGTRVHTIFIWVIAFAPRSNEEKKKSVYLTAVFHLCFAAEHTAHVR